MKKMKRYAGPEDGSMVEGDSNEGKKSNPDAYAKGGSVSSASKRGDGIAQRGKTRGRVV